MEYLVAKWLHVLSSTILFGTGIGTAFYIFFCARTGNATVVAAVMRYAVIADCRKETGSPYVCLNATSHWLWGDGAARHQEASLRYTVAGYAIHHAASCFWGVLYERALGEKTASLSATPRLAAGMAAAGVACFVDFRVLPHRLSPGFELRLSRRAITAGYLAFGLELALAGQARSLGRRSDRAAVRSVRMHKGSAGPRPGGAVTPLPP